MSGLGFIELEGVTVHNLRNVSLKIRHNALTVICGVSGSGKSSLAFDTLYAEGQRRYIETFSPSARQFLDRIERPAADRISGLPPAIAIRQQLRSDGVRTTLGTRSEILDSLRILTARLGQQFCPACGHAVESVSPESAARQIVEQETGSRIMIVADTLSQTGSVSEHVSSLVSSGFTRGIFNGRTVRLEQISELTTESNLMIVVDRLKADSASEARIAEAMTSAMKLNSGTCKVLIESSNPRGENIFVDDARWNCRPFSSSRICAGCRREMPEMSPELLSFASPLGACPECEGAGRVGQRMLGQRSSLARKKKTVPEGDVVCSACHGSRLNRDAVSVRWDGKNLPELCALEVAELHLWLQAQRSTLTTALQKALQPVFEHATFRLRFLEETGLGYLSLERSMKSLSGGEAQRVMLTSALGSGLINTLYVLDEPTCGLHATDTQKIIAAVRRLQESGNTVVVVEHDPVFILAADEIVEIGPGAGEVGGTIVFQGSVADLQKSSTLTATKLQQFLARRTNEPAQVTAKPVKARRGGARKSAIEATSDVSDSVAAIPKAALNSVTSRKRRIPEQWLSLKNVHCHNISALNIELPLGVFCAVTGVSGSGKSSLIADTLYPALCREMKLPVEAVSEGSVEGFEGISQLENVLLLDQSPVQRSRRSIPATWIGVFDDIRVLLAETHEARKRNYSRAMFSFNASSGGRCPVCEGRGVVTVAMQFLADVETVCEECNGRRFRSDVIEIRYRDRSVFDILNMTADDAFVFFNGHHRIQQRLNAVRQTGLGYLRLGQPLSTISGGEAQRLRIAAMLAGVPLSDGDMAAQNRKDALLTRSGRTLFLLDEPSCGLHLQDIDRLITCIDFLLQTGHSVIVIDHDDSLTSQADWTIEMGPGAGKLGGRVLSSRPN